MTYILFLLPLLKRQIQSIVGTLCNRFIEMVVTCTHDFCFELIKTTSVYPCKLHLFILKVWFEGSNSHGAFWHGARVKICCYV